MNKDFEKQLEEISHWLQKEYASIRTGQANPSLLDGVKVESYGAMMPLNQVANIGSEDARTLRVSPWDSSQVSVIEKAIIESDLGVSVMTDSSGLRVIFPELTAERREQLQKLAKSKLEEARIRVRSARDDKMKQIEKAEKAGDTSEDEMFTQKEAAQNSVDAANKKLDEMFTQKETELKS